VILARIGATNLFTVAVRLIDRRPSQRARRADWRQRLLVGWCGLRGAVSLAAALALPADFPRRDLVIFLAFCVVVATLVGQGLSLSWLIRRLGVSDDGARAREELGARQAAADAAVARLRELRDAAWTNPDSVDRLLDFYEFRRNRLAQRAGAETERDYEAQSQSYQRLLGEVLETEHAALLARRSAGLLSDDVMRGLEHEIDLQLERLQTA
jgi:CPA1 family monovalent cation:H+ antiporter